MQKGGENQQWQTGSQLRQKSHRLGFPSTLRLFWEVLLLQEKDAQTPISTGKLSESLALEKGGTPGRFPSGSFVIDMAQCRDAYFLFPYLDGTTNLQLIAFAF